jgi:hypothetical protein
VERVCVRGVTLVCVSGGARGSWHRQAEGLGALPHRQAQRLAALPHSSTRASQRSPSRLLLALSTGIVSMHTWCLAGTSRKPAVLKRVPWAQN